MLCTTHLIPRLHCTLHTACCTVTAHAAHFTLCSACHMPQKAARAATDALCSVKEAEPLSVPSQKALLFMGLKGVYSLPSRQDGSCRCERD